MEKAKHKPFVGVRFPFSTNQLPFDLVCPFALTECAARLKKLGAAHPTSESVFIQVDPETQRFHITTRAFRAHLLEAEGYLKRVSDTATQVEGQVFSDSIAAPLFAIAMLAIAAGVLFFMNLWIILLGIFAASLVASYCKYLIDSTHRDQREMVKQIQAAIAPKNNE